MTSNELSPKKSKYPLYLAAYILLATLLLSWQVEAQNVTGQSYVDSYRKRENLIDQRRMQEYQMLEQYAANLIRGCTLTSSDELIGIRDRITGFRHNPYMPSDSEVAKAAQIINQKIKEGRCQ